MADHPLRRTLSPLDPVFVLYLVHVATLPLARWPIILMLGFPIQISDVLLAATYAVWIVRLLRDRVAPQFDKLLVASAAYLSILAFSIVAAHGSLQHLIKLAAYAPLVVSPWLAVHILRSEERWQAAIHAWPYGGLVAIGIALAGVVVIYVGPAGLARRMSDGYGALPALPVPRLSAPFGHPNMLANYLTVLIGIVLGFGSTFFRHRGAVLTMAAACCAVALLTLSAGFGGFMVAVAVALGGGAANVHMRVVSRFAMNAVALGGALFFLIASVVNVESGRARIWDGSRPWVWRAAAATVEASPFLGVGYGAPVVKVTDPRAWLPRTRWSTEAATIPHGTIVPLEAHNVWLSVLGQAGVVGLIAFSALIVVLLKPLASGGSDPRRVVLIAAVAGAFVYHGLVASIEESRHIWALFGLIAAYANIRASNKTIELE